jgi:photosystem II stability/assembly factor-like uncharacterized protein
MGAGYTGTLACTSGCTFDLSGCVPPITSVEVWAGGGYYAGGDLYKNMYHTSDGGATCTQQINTHFANWPGPNCWWIETIDVLDDGLVGAYTGCLDDYNDYFNDYQYYTSNGGVNWISQGQTRSDVDLLDSLNAYAAFMGASSFGLSKTTDAGTTWTNVQIMSYPSMPGWEVEAKIDFVDLNNGWLIMGYTETTRGEVYHTTDGGVTLVNETDNGCPDAAYTDVDAVDANNAWVVGKQGTICRTSDGGTTWVQQPSGMPGATFKEVDFVDTNTGYIVGGNFVLKTTNGGTTWSQLVLPSMNRVDSIDFLTDQIGYVGGARDIGTSPDDYQIVIMTEDGGQTWQDSFAISLYSTSFYAIDVIGDIE